MLQKIFSFFKLDSSKEGEEGRREMKKENASLDFEVSCSVIPSTGAEVSRPSVKCYLWVKSSGVPGAQQEGKLGSST